MCNPDVGQNSPGKWPIKILGEHLLMYPMFDIEKARNEIEARNRIRLEAQLPPVSIGAELRKLYELNRQNEFEHFFQTSPFRMRVEKKLLKVARRMRDDPQWVPTGVLSGGRLGFYLWTRKLMMRLWERQHRHRV
jgi:hypothetical protein